VAEFRQDFPESSEGDKFRKSFVASYFSFMNALKNFLQILTLKWLEKVGHILNKFAKAREKYYFYKGPNFLR
jgi:hypothetical protein